VIALVLTPMVLGYTATRLWWEPAGQPIVAVSAEDTRSIEPSVRASSDAPYASPRPRGGTTTPGAPDRPSSDRDSTPAARSEPETPRRGSVPLSLTAPALGISVPVVPIDDAGGELVPPADPQQIGWWEDGARPGATTGTALLTGHTVHTGGGAFDDLGDLEVGDLVRVDTVRRTIDYRVVSVDYYDREELAERAADIFSQEVPGRIVLITCDRWDGETYHGNTVVVAVPSAA
jgi:LPXTG-site transpeptidase (sortase) family protein